MIKLNLEYLVNYCYGWITYSILGEMDCQVRRDDLGGEILTFTYFLACFLA